MRSLLALTVLLFAVPALAVDIEWVTVGDPGNDADTEVMLCCGDLTGTTGFGSVAYPYRIGKYEVTNAQYVEFLNAVAATDDNNLWAGDIMRVGLPGIYTYSVIPGREDMPLNVSFWSALRFANWLHNGQPSGAQDSTTTEDGAYTLIKPFWGIVRNQGATIFLPSEDEWYKAAYYDPVSSSYFDYPAGTDTVITCAAPGATPNTANCEGVVGDLTDVGSYTGSASPSGTFDQGGNVSEWNETRIDVLWRGERGESFSTGNPYLLGAYTRNSQETGSGSLGFRLASTAVSVCDDGLDNDGDGLTDFVGGDPGCADSDDWSEQDPALLCDDGKDNDGDGFVDYADDPGCLDPGTRFEDPACQDGFDNDGDGRIDFDGGQSIFGECADGVCPPGVSDAPPYGVADPDPQCVGRPSWSLEHQPRSSCGLGAELALVTPLLLWLSRRRRRSVH